MDAYRKFYNDHKDKLFQYLLRLSGNHDLAKDLIQESFTRYLEKYRKKPLNTALLYTIARNAFYDLYRKQKQQTDITDDIPDASFDQEQLIMIREEYRQVIQAMHRLGDTERDILSLVISQDLSYSEIAAVTHMTVSNIKVNVHRARLKLRQIISKGGK